MRNATKVLHAGLPVPAQGFNALAIAEFLTSRPWVRRVRYPGLPAFPVASRQMQTYGPVVSFELASEMQAERFLGACALVLEATNFGPVYTTAECRARWGGDDVPPGFIRLSAGCEDVRDLLEDLARALDMSWPGGGR